MTGASEGRSASERGAPSPGHPDRTGGAGALPRQLEVGSAIAWDGEGLGGKASSSRQAGAEVALRHLRGTSGPESRTDVWAQMSMGCLVCGEPPRTDKSQCKGQGTGGHQQGHGGSAGTWEGQWGHGQVSKHTGGSAGTEGSHENRGSVGTRNGQWGPGTVREEDRTRAGGVLGVVLRGHGHGA